MRDEVNEVIIIIIKQIQLLELLLVHNLKKYYTLESETSIVNLVKFI